MRNALLKVMSRRGPNRIAHPTNKGNTSVDVTALRTRKVGKGPFPWKLERTTWPLLGKAFTTEIAAFASEQEAEAAQVFVQSRECQ